MSYKYLDASTFRGETIKSIKHINTSQDDEIHFELENGKKYRIFHNPDCCESVVIHDIKEELQSLIGSTITNATEKSCNGDDRDFSDWPNDVEKGKYSPESWTWTTYLFETGNTKVQIRWIGTSNGYYSEDVQIEEVE
jgi:hypothetical protein